MGTSAFTGDMLNEAHRTLTMCWVLGGLFKYLTLSCKSPKRWVLSSSPFHRRDPMTCSRPPNSRTRAALALVLCCPPRRTASPCWALQGTLPVISASQRRPRRCGTLSDTAGVTQRGRQSRHSLPGSQNPHSSPAEAVPLGAE